MLPSATLLFQSVRMWPVCGNPFAYSRVSVELTEALAADIGSL